MDSFYSKEELISLGLIKIGNGVKISRKSSIYTNDIIIGDNVRVDDFCILSGKIRLGNYIHIAAYSALYGGTEGIYVKDYANISSRVSIYAISDDYSGDTMTNPMIPEEYKNVEKRKVIINKHVIIGATSVLLPGVVLGEGSAFGSYSFINKNSEEWSINVGIPAKKIKERSKKCLRYESKINK